MALSFENVGNTDMTADRLQIDILLDNLIGNAIRYTPAYGNVAVVVSELEEATLLQVIDDGPGIAPEERERVFDRFYRIPRRQIDDAAVGSGLGLAIVKVVTERHGGEVTLTTPGDGRGLEVRVVFPRPVRT
jgi:signal transduction histidine kinase